MVAAVATLEPLMAAKPAHAATVAIASPPRRCFSQICAVAYSSRPMPVSLAIWPISTNSGTTLRT